MARAAIILGLLSFSVPESPGTVPVSHIVQHHDFNKSTDEWVLTLVCFAFVTGGVKLLQSQVGEQVCDVALFSIYRQW